MIDARMVDEDGLVRVMSAGRLFVEAVDPNEFLAETRVLDEVDLWSLLFECGLEPMTPDEALLSALNRNEGNR